MYTDYTTNKGTKVGWKAVSKDSFLDLMAQDVFGESMKRCFWWEYEKMKFLISCLSQKEKKKRA